MRACACVCVRVGVSFVRAMCVRRRGAPTKKQETLSNFFLIYFEAKEEEVRRAERKRLALLASLKHNQSKRNQIYRKQVKSVVILQCVIRQYLARRRVRRMRLVRDKLLIIHKLVVR